MVLDMNVTLIWLGIFFCITQSAMFSGLNLAFFSFTRLRLEGTCLKTDAFYIASDRMINFILIF